MNGVKNTKKSLLQILTCAVIAGLLTAGCSQTEMVTVDTDASRDHTPDQISVTVYEQIVTANYDTTHRLVPGAFIRIYEEEEMFHGNRSYSADRFGQFRLPLEDLILGENYIIEVMDSEGFSGSQHFVYDQDAIDIFAEPGMDIIIDQNLRLRGETRSTDVEIMIGDPRRVRIDN